MRSRMRFVGWLYAITVAVISGIAIGSGEFSLLVLPTLPLGLALSIAAPHYLLFIVAAVWSIFWLPSLPVDLLMGAKELVIYAYLVSMILRSNLNKHKMFTLMFRAPTSKLIVVFIIAALPGLILSPTPSTSFLVWIRFVAALLIYGTLLYHFVLKPSIIQAAFLVALASLLPSVLLVLANHLGIFQPLDPPAQYATVVRDPASLGLSYTQLGLSWTVAFVVPVAIAYWFHAWKHGKGIVIWLWAIVSASLILVCVFTHGRGGLIAASAGATTTLIMMRRNTGGPLLLLLTLVLLVILFNAPYLLGVLLHTNETGYTVEQTMSGSTNIPFLQILTSGRTNIYGAGIRVFTEFPVTGVGLGQFGKRVLVPMGWSSSGAHNLYLSVAVESGVSALLAISAIMIYILIHYFRLSNRLVQEPNGFLAAAAYGIIIASFFNTLVEYGVMFTSLYSGLPFWIAVAAIDGLNLGSSIQEQTHTKRTLRQPKSVSAGWLAGPDSTRD